MNDLTAQERAGMIAWQLAQGRRLTTRDVARLTGLTQPGAWYLMMKLSRVISISCNDFGEWYRVEERISR